MPGTGLGCAADGRRARPRGRAGSGGLSRGDSCQVWAGRVARGPVLNSVGDGRVLRRGTGRAGAYCGLDRFAVRVLCLNGAAGPYPHVGGRLPGGARLRGGGRGVRTSRAGQTRATQDQYDLGIRTLTAERDMLVGASAKLAALLAD